jgi:hypothetical protein
MRVAVASIGVVALSALALTIATAQAEGLGSGAGHKQQPKADKTAAQKPKADEKSYSAALKGIPDKQFDPWHGVR